MIPASPIVAINLALELALLEDGRTAPFDVMFDPDGEPTDDAYAASTATVAHPDHCWVVIRLDEFDHVTTH